MPSNIEDTLLTTIEEALTVHDTVHTILTDRGRSHGLYDENARFAQAIKVLCQSSPNWQRMTEVQRESLDMFAVKLGRILAGDPMVKDHWADIAGYATLVVERL